MAACFHQGGLGHTIETLECHILKSLHKCFNWLSFLLPGRQESWHGNFRVIFEEACKEKLLQITSVLDGAFWELHEPFKSDPLHGVDEQTYQDGII